MEYIPVVLFFILVSLWAYAASTADPTPRWRSEGRNDAINAYNYTKTVPRCPTADDLIDSGYSVDYIKNYIIGFKEGIEEIEQYENEHI